MHFWRDFKEKSSGKNTVIIKKKSVGHGKFNSDCPVRYGCKMRAAFRS